MAVLMIVLGNPRSDLPDALAQYQGVARATIARAGGEIIARGKLAKVLVGHGAHKAAVVLRFPSLAAVEQWYKDPEYQQVLPLRQQIFGDSLELAVFEE